MPKPQQNPNQNPNNETLAFNSQGATHRKKNNKDKLHIIGDHVCKVVDIVYEQTKEHGIIFKLELQVAEGPAKGFKFAVTEFPESYFPNGWQSPVAQRAERMGNIKVYVGAVYGQDADSSISVLTDEECIAAWKRPISPFVGRKVIVEVIRHYPKAPKAPKPGQKQLRDGRGKVYTTYYAVRPYADPDTRINPYSNVEGYPSQGVNEQEERISAGELQEIADIAAEEAASKAKPRLPGKAAKKEPTTEELLEKFGYVRHEGEPTFCYPEGSTDDEDVITVEDFLERCKNA